MWTVTLPYPPNAEVWIPECNHLGNWHAIHCKIRGYVIHGKNYIEVALVDRNNRYKLATPTKLCESESAALELAKKLQAERTK